MNQSEKFDAKKEYDAEIAPLVREILRRCNDYGIPMFFAAAVAETEENGTVYKNEMLSCNIAGRQVSNDRIARFCNVLQVYNVIHPNEEFEMSADEELFVFELGTQQ